MQVGAYESTGVIHASERSVVERGVRLRDGLEVVIKSSAARTADAAAVARLRNEWSITRLFDSPAVPRVLELVEGVSEMALVFAGDAQLLALDQRSARGRLPLRDALRVALGIIDGLAQIHAKSVVHKDIKPSNVLVDASYSRVVLIDFGIATVVPRELGRRVAEARFEGTLGYLPPEQTGRINRPVDYRSDYYALGATIYWMLSGARPFAELEAFEAQLHAQLTRLPPRLDQLDPEIPAPVADIVAKLLAKAADERYQGSFGLRADLERCLAALTAGETLEAFEIAARDPSERLRPPRRLHGREREVEVLAATVEAAMTGGPQLVSLRGPSGVGKSMLVDELRARMSERSVVFASSKFDQFTRASPHAGAGQLLRSLFEQLRGGALVSERELEGRVREALGPNASLLVGLVPELERSLGKLGMAAPVGPAEARDRFLDTLERFTDALLIPTLDFVVFIDDVQWADASSLRLLENLCLGPARRLTLILAWRDDDLAATHPLPAMFANLHAAKRAYTRIDLGPLPRTAIEALVEDVFGGIEEGPAFAELLHRRTHGTPLYVAQLIMAYYAEGIIDMDRRVGSWRVDMARASARTSSGDVIDFLVEQLEALPADVRRLLGIAACIGTRFDVETLAAAAEEPASQVSAMLWGAVSSGHLQPLLTSTAARGMPRVQQGTRTRGGLLEYTFVHDRVQQIARGLVIQTQAPLYLGLARRLAARGATSDAQIHAIADYIGRALECVEDAEERARFAELCRRAGDRARAKAGFSTAVSHYRTALQLVDSARDPALAFELSLTLAESLVMDGELGDANEAFARARALAVEPLALPRLLLSEVTLAMVKGQTERALVAAMQAVELFELDLRRGGDQAWIGARMGTVLGRIAGLDDAAITGLKALDDPRLLILSQLLLETTNAAYFDGDMNLYAGLSLAIVELGLDAGVADTVGVAFTMLALVVSSALGDYEGARRFSALGRELLERTPESPLWCMAEVIQGTAIQPWVEHMGSSIPLLKRAYVRSRAAGRFTTAGYAQFMVVANAFAMGVSLPRVLDDAAHSLLYLESIGDRPLVLATQAHARASELLAASELPAPDRDDLLAVDLSDPSAMNPAAYVMSQSVELCLALLFGERERASATLERVEPFLAAGTGLFPWIVLRVLALVHACEGYAVLDPEARAAHAETLATAREGFVRWEASCPENATPFVALLDGVWAEARGELDQARRAYAKAADAAAASGFANIEGYACERGGQVWLELGERRASVGYLEHAAQAYARWGARALERRVNRRLQELGFARGTSTEGTQLPATTDTIHALDVSSIVRMSVALSEAIHLDEAVALLLETASQNAGADRSALLLENDGVLSLRAEQAVGEALRDYDPPLPLQQAREMLALSVVRACLRRERAVIVDDARADTDADPYLEHGNIRALLAMPIIKHGERIGLLYLENRVTPGAFTHQHLRVLSTLAVQAAVTLDNARLFDALRAREARWRALVDSAPDSIMIVESDHSVSFANRDEGGGSEGTQASSVGPSIESFAVPEERERVAAAIDYVFATGTQTSYEAARIVDGERRRFTTRLGAIRHEGSAEIEGVTAISTDVTSQRELEQQFRQSQKMQAVGTLAGGVAHDFNNLLMIIMGAAELGIMELEELGEDPESPVLDSFDEITAAAERAARLTRQLLAFSRKQVLQPEHLELGALVRESSRMLGRLIGENIELRLELGEQPCYVYVDPGQLEQVVLNLVVNARDAMLKGGDLSLRVTECRLGEGDPRRPATLAAGAYVCLEVVDTGTGMRPEVIARIFEPFYTTKDQGKGTGLGLSTVHGIVEQSGGHIEVESELGTGTCFRLYFPLDTRRSQAVAAVVEAEADSSSLEGAVILVVEDEEAVAALVAKILRGRGCEVFVAYNHEQAVAQARSNARIDLVFADVILPGDNGRVAAESVVALHPAARVLFTSGYTDDAVMRHGVIQGTVAFLQKPFTPEALARAVRDELGAGR